MKKETNHPSWAQRLAPLAMSAMAIGLAACGGGDGAADTGPATPAAPALSAQIAARTNYFGAENVDQQTGDIRKDLVIMSWLSNTTYAAAINGSVVLLDASLLRREDTAAGRTPTTLAEMVAAMPSYLLVGKAAPGHADLAAHIAFKTGATLVGTQEQCDAMEADGRRQQAYSGSAKVLKCTAIIPAGQAAGKSVNALALPALGACLRAVKQTDTAVAVADPLIPADKFDWSFGTDLRDLIYWPLGKPASDGVGTSAVDDKSSVLYHLTLAGGQRFGIVWHDRSGSLKELAPAVAAQLRTLPKTDVHIGSVDVGNAAVNGFRDVAYYLQSIGAKIFFLSGQDAASQRAGALNTAELAKRELQASMANIGIAEATAPELRVNFDRSDYVKPHYMSFDPGAPAWQRASDRISSNLCE